MAQNPLPYKIKQWKKEVTKNGCSIDATRDLVSIAKRNGEHLFSLMDVTVSAPEGYKLPHVVFIRGHAVVVIPHLRNSDTGKEKFLMVRQRRIGNGSLSIEFPAGMLDNEEDTPSGVAVRELFEETGLEVGQDELVPLSDRPLYSSVGAADEAIFYFGVKMHLSDREFNALDNRENGNRNENEYITTFLCTRSEIEKAATSLQVICGLFLFERQFCN